MTLSGHAIPASFFIGFGVFILSNTLYQACHVPPGSCISEHTFDRKPSILRKIAILVMISTAIGIIYEGCNGLFNITGDYGSNFFHEITHETLYLSFSFTSVVMLLESNHRLPPNSSRLAMTVTSLVQYILWDEHAHMKKGAMLTIHELIAQVCLVSAGAFLYAAKYPSSVAAFVFSFALMVLEGTWIMAAGLNEIPGHAMTMHQVGSFFCLHVLVIGLVIIVATACVYKRVAGEGEMIRGKEGGEQYERVAITSVIDDNDGELHTNGLV